jgi:hypothetical protein
MKATASNIIRLAGLAAMGSGILFIAIQVIHPIDLLSSVTTARWAIVHYIAIAMCLLGLFGVTGIYARQVEETGWLGLAGYLLLSFFYALTLAFQFVEALISPVLAKVSPEYVEGFLGVASGNATGFDMGTLPMVYTLVGLVGYLLGGLLFGIAIFRAGVLPRWAGGLLAFAVLLPLVTAPLIPHPYDRILAVPMALALVWLGYALWSEQREKATETLPGTRSRQLRRAGAK